LSSVAETAHGGEADRHHPDLVHHFESLPAQKEAATLGMWVFLVTEVMFFGGLFLVYTIYRNIYFHAFVQSSRHLDLTLGAVNTAVLIGSSLTMAMGVHSAALGRRRATVTWLLLTVALGSVFLGIKAVEYKDKFDHHLVPGERFQAEELHLEGEEARPAQIFYALYFAMTGLHATHMVIGVPIILILAGLAHRGRFSPEYHTPVEMTGLYWHFVDIIWIFLFPLLYLIGRHH
jgi:cytochrome c oxidase subunit III